MSTDGLTFKILLFMQRHKADFPGPVDRIKLDGFSSQDIADRLDAMIKDGLIALDSRENSPETNDGQQPIVGVTDKGERLLDGALKPTRKYPIQDLLADEEV